jgi:hypothetical protein
LSDIRTFSILSGSAVARCLWSRDSAAQCKEHDMKHKQHQHSERLVDLGAAKTLTKGILNNGPQDDPTSNRQFQMGLNAE